MSIEVFNKVLRAAREERKNLGILCDEKYGEMSLSEHKTFLF